MRFAASLFLLLFFFNQNSFAQGNTYERVDSIMRYYKEKIKSADDLFKVVYFIRQNFKEDSIRLRASFIWITENINYDVEAYQKEDPTAARLDYVVKKKKKTNKTTYDSTIYCLQRLIARTGNQSLFF